MKLLDETGLDETQPFFQLNQTAKDRMPAYNQRNFPQRSFMQKQRLLFEGKIRPKENEIEQIGSYIPTKEALDDWIAQSKALGESLRERRHNS